MDVYWMFFKLVVSTIITFLEAAAVLFAPVAVNRSSEPQSTAPRLVRAAARVPQPDARTLISQLNSPDPAVRARAACDLEEMERAAAPAVPALIELLSDATKVDALACEQRRKWRRSDSDSTTPGERAAAALASIGGASVEPLIQAAQSREWFARKNAVWALGALDDARAVETVVRALRDPEAPVRRNAAWALGALEARTAVPPLTDALKDADAETRADAAWALGAIGEPRASDALAAALKDADVKVRRQAAWALGAIAK